MGWEDALGPAGGIVGALFGSKGQGQANDQNWALAQQQMAFQDLARKTAHQTEVNDLVAAGLNPVLSGGGNGASTPSGASADMKNPVVNMPDFMAYGLSLKQMALAERKLDIDAAGTMAQISNTTKKTDSEVSVNEMKKMLMNKGAPRAILEGEAAEIIRKGLKWLHQNATMPSFKNFSMDPDDAENKKFYSPKNNPYLKGPR